MKVPSEFDAIRPFEPEELPEVMERLIADPQFRMVMGYVFADVPFDALAAKMRQCKDNLSFQYTFPYVFLKQLIAKASTGCDMDHSSIDLNKRYTFISNHRDIVLDSALLDVLLFDAKCTTTCEIAIGDNLLAAPWIKDLVRVNKSFIVERSAGIREMLASSKRLSEYMHFVIAHKHDNIWIAQREGRAKDSDDRTQESVLKMLSLGGKLQELNIVPLCISYEYDPCDYLKAKEFQLKRDNSAYKKSKQDDLENMKVGIMGYKGRIHYECAPCINEWLGELEGMPKADFFAEVARRMDREIHAGYKLFPGNFIAMDMLSGKKDYADHYTADDVARFNDYLSKQLAKIDIPNKDEAFLRNCILNMYANPAKNKLAL